MDYIVFKHIKNDKLDKKKVNKYLNTCEILKKFSKNEKKCL